MKVTINQILLLANFLFGIIKYYVPKRLIKEPPGTEKTDETVPK